MKPTLSFELPTSQSFMAFFSRLRESIRASKAQKSEKESVEITPKPSRPTSPCKRDIPHPRTQNFSRPLSTTLTPQEFSARLAARQTTQKSTRPMSTTLTPQEFSARVSANKTIPKSTRPASTTLTPEEFTARLAAKETIHTSARSTSNVLTPNELSARIAARRQTAPAATAQPDIHPALRHARSWSDISHSNRPRWSPRESPIPAVRRLQLEEIARQASNRKSYATRRKSPLSNLAMVQEPDDQGFDSETSPQSSQESSRRTSISSRSSVNGECPDCKSRFHSDSSLVISEPGTSKEKPIVQVSAVATDSNEEQPRGHRSTVASWRYSRLMADAEPIMVERVQPFRTGKSPRRSSLFHRRAISLSSH